MRHLISILVENEAGALSRISGLFSARGYNIESLTVAPTEDASMSRMTIVTSGSDDVVEQITKQLNKLIDVVKVVNLNNRYMGMVRQWQEFFHGNRYAESYMDALPDFVKLAEAYGHVGMLIDKPADVEPALREAFKMKDRLVFMDFITDQTENVFPMVPGGKGMSEMILSEEL